MFPSGPESTLRGDDSVESFTYSNLTPIPDCFAASGPCEGSEFFFPQFDPSLGTLNSVAYTFEGSAELLEDANTCGATGPANYSYTTTGTDTFLGISVSRTVSGSGIQDPGECAGYGVVGQLSNFTATGYFSDLAQFIENGSGLGFNVTPSVSGVLYMDDGGLPVNYDVAQSRQEYDTLTLSYDYTPAVPEPRLVSLMCLSCGIILIVRRRLLRKAN